MINIITWPYRLRRGHSADPSGGACAMDAVNWLAHGEHGDHPECACPVITNFVIPANDEMDDATRQRFLPYLHRIAGSRSPEHEAARLRIVVLAAARVSAPAVLEAAGLDASALRAIPDDATYGQICMAAWSAERQAAAVSRGGYYRRRRRGTRLRRGRRRRDYGGGGAVGVDGCGGGGTVGAVGGEGGNGGMGIGGNAPAAAAAVSRGAGAWDAYFSVLDEALRAGPQGEPWSADVVESAVTAWDETWGIRFYVDGKLAASKEETTAIYNAGLDQFGPHMRIISPWNVQSDYNFVRGGDIDELRIYDRMLADDNVTALARGEALAAIPPAARDLADPRWRDEWAFRYGWNRPADPPPYLEGAAISIRKVEIHDAYDFKRWYWKATDGIRETTWPGVHNRSRLPGRNDYVQLPDWDCYSLSGKSITFTMPDEPCKPPGET